MFHEKRKIKDTGKKHYGEPYNKKLSQLNDATEKYDFKNVWSHDGKTLYTVNNEVKFITNTKLMTLNIYGKSL